MRLLEYMEITDVRGQRRRVELFEGDLVKMPPDYGVDLLVVSAYPNNYQPIEGTLVKALSDAGIWLETLALVKAVDLRKDFGCWLSQEISSHKFHFKRLLCFEPYQRGQPAEVVGDIFQAIMPVVNMDAYKSLAMPLVASGHQKADATQMLNSLLQATAHWLEMGMPLERILIVEINPKKAAGLAEGFRRFRNNYAAAKRMGIKHWNSFTEHDVEDTSPEIAATTDDTSLPSTYTYDLFISYSRKNAVEIELFAQHIKRIRPELNIFLDRQALNTGSSWQQALYEALDDCKKVVAFYSPYYLNSKVCKEEFNIALFRHRDSDEGVLMPVMLFDTNLPTYMKLIQYSDAGNGDMKKLQEIAMAFARSI